MADVSRREFVSLGAMAGVLAGGDVAGAAPVPPAPVDFAGDGVPLSPADYAALLAQLTATGTIIADEYSRGGAVEAVEAQFAALLGKEAAVFMPSGTLANHLAIRALARERRRVVVQDASHLYNDSGDCAQQLSQLNLIPLAPGRATFTWADVRQVLERAASGRVATAIGAISIESPVRRLHGEMFDFDETERICGEARSRGIGLHLDGARLFVAAAYTGRSPAVIASPFDTVYVSLWKCFNAASGAVLAGPRALLADMYQMRRMFGGALWGAWPHTAVARHYADGYLARLTAAVAIAEALMAALAGEPRLAIERVAHGTSLFRMRVTSVEPEVFRARLGNSRIGLPPADGDGFWLKVNETLARSSAAALAAAFRSALA